MLIYKKRVGTSWENFISDFGDEVETSNSVILLFFSGAIALELCHVMVTMATQIPSVLAPLRSEILSHFAKVVINADDDSKESKDLVVCVFF